MKSVLFVVPMLLIAGCYKVNIHYAPDDTIFIFPESPLIEYGLSDKKMSYSFNYMKNKKERFKYIKKIESLNEVALKKFRKRTLTAKKYHDITYASQIALQLTSWIAIMEVSQGKMVGKQITREELSSSLKNLKVNDPEMDALIQQSHFETEDGILEFLKNSIKIMEAILNENN